MVDDDDNDKNQKKKRYKMGRIWLTIIIPKQFITNGGNSSRTTKQGHLTGHLPIYQI